MTLQFEFLKIMEKNSQHLAQNTTLSNLIIYGRLGRGSTAHVFKVRSRITNKYYAMKVIDKQGLHFDPNHLKNQVEIHKLLKHSNIVDYIADFEDHQNYYMLTEYCDGGQVTKLLLDSPSQASHIDYEKKIIQIAQQLAQAINYLHNQAKVFHGDIKLGNILLSQQQIKLCDFGFAQKKQSNNYFQNSSYIKGTLIYNAPQILEYPNKYQNILKADIWAYGISILILIIKETPYNYKDTKQLKNQIINGNWKKPIKLINQNLLDLIEKCLNNDPKQRISASQIVQHKVFQKYKQCDKIKKESQLDKTADSLSCFRVDYTDHQNGESLMRICTKGLKPQKYDMKNDCYVRIQQNGVLTVKVKKNMYKIDPLGQNIYIQFKATSQKNNKIKKFRYKDLVQGKKTSDQIVSYYQYAIQLLKIIKKQQNIKNAKWLSDHVYCWTQVDKQNNSMKSLFYDSQLQIISPTQSPKKCYKNNEKQNIDSTQSKMNNLKDFTDFRHQQSANEKPIIIQHLKQRNVLAEMRN